MYSGVAGEGWQPWDYAAGWLFIEEAGGIVTQVSMHRGEGGGRALCVHAYFLDERDAGSAPRGHRHLAPRCLPTVRKYGHHHSHKITTGQQ